MKTIATIEARMASTRLPGKALADLAGRPMLHRLVERVARSREVDGIVLATTTAPEDDVLETQAQKLGVGCHRGSVEDVLGRVLGAAQAHGADHLVALTGDNPLVDPDLIDDVVAFYRQGKFDYVTTTHMHHSRHWRAERTFPVGVSVQVFSTRTLAEASAGTTDPIDREHVSFYIYNHPERYRLGAFVAEGKYAAWNKPGLRLTVDMAEDLVLMRAIFGSLYPGNASFSTGEAICLVDRDPVLKAMNAHVRQRIASEQKPAHA